MKIALGLVTGIVLLAGQNTGTPSSHGEDILSWVQWPAPMACPPQQQHAGASRWFAPTIMRHCGAGGIGSPGGRTAAPVRSVVKQPRRPTNCGGTDSPLVDELALCRRDCSPARGSPQPPQPTAANFSSTPERVFFHGANRSEATAVLSLRCRYRWSGQFWARGTR